MTPSMQSGSMFTDSHICACGAALPCFLPCLHGREQILGKEAEMRVPPEFVVQVRRG
jgi:hypothetical protein